MIAAAFDLLSAAYQQQPELVQRGIVFVAILAGIAASVAFLRVVGLAVDQTLGPRDLPPSWTLQNVEPVDPGARTDRARRHRRDRESAAARAAAQAVDRGGDLMRTSRDTAIVLALLATVFTAVGCTPHQPDREQADADVKAMTFVRHSNGLCFGVVRFTTYYGYQGVSITHVPSEACR